MQGQTNQGMSALTITFVVVGGFMGVVVVIGILAAVAIPAFIRYVRLAKTSEAEENITRIAQSAVDYALQEHIDSNGQILPPRFPESAPMTPSGSCANFDDGRCPGNPSEWNHQTWRDLNFSISDPHYFQYQFVSDGTTFTARAIGDLDNDGINSVFERTGMISADGTPRLSPNIYKEQPTE